MAGGAFKPVDDSCGIFDGVHMEVEELVAGTGIAIDNTDPANPIITALAAVSGTVTSVTAGAGLTQTGDPTIDPTLDVAASDASIVVNANDIQVGVISATQHGVRTNGTRHANANSTTSGFMTAANFTKISNYPTTPTPSAFCALGSQGSFTASSGALTGTVYAINYTIPNGVTITAASYGIICSGTFTGGATGVLSNAGAAGSGSSGQSGGAVGAHGQAGGPGANGQTTNGSNASTQTACVGGVGGVGGDGTSGTGGTGGVSTPPTDIAGGVGIVSVGLYAYHGRTAGQAGTTFVPSTGGGGGGGAGVGKAGGGGGGGGGVVFVSARTMVLASGFTFTARGGNGAAGTAVGTGGGGGGAGGLITLFYYQLTDGGAVYNVDGGTGGSSGGTGGSAGSDGAPGATYMFSVI